MKTSDFLRKYRTDEELATWALSIGDDMADVWDAMIEQGKHDWIVWASTRPGVFSDSELRKLACRFVRETPLLDGRKVWDLLINERSRKAVEVAERYADGKATKKELADARNAALAAAYNAAYEAANAAANAAANVAAKAAYAAVYAADYDAAEAAHAAAYGSVPVTTYAAAKAAAEAAYGSAHVTAYVAASAAQIRMIAQLGNPFREESVK